MLQRSEKFPVIGKLNIFPTFIKYKRKQKTKNKKKTKNKRKNKNKNKKKKPHIEMLIKLIGIM